jgi:hypothetical protein
MEEVSKKGGTLFQIETYIKEHGMGLMIELLIR